MKISEILLSTEMGKEDRLKRRMMTWRTTERSRSHTAGIKLSRIGLKNKNQRDARKREEKLYRMIGLASLNVSTERKNGWKEYRTNEISLIGLLNLPSSNGS